MQGMTAAFALAASLRLHCGANDLWALFKASGGCFQQVEAARGPLMPQQCRNSSRLSQPHVHPAGLKEKSPFFYVWRIIKARLSIDSDGTFVAATVWFCQSTGGVFVE